MTFRVLALPDDQFDRIKYNIAQIKEAIEAGVILPDQVLDLPRDTFDLIKSIASIADLKKLQDVFKALSARVI